MRPVDAVLALACAVTAAGPAMDSTLFGGSPFAHWHPPVWVAVPVAVAIGAAALVRRERPEFLVGAALAGWVLAAAYPAVLLAQYSLGAHGPSRRRIAAGTVLVTVAVGAPFHQKGLDALLPVTGAICVLPTAVGLWVRDRARRADRARLRAAERARAEERARIAHDMHDVVTHRVSLMVLHATALEVSDPAEHGVLARRIGAIGREALDELRTLVGVLHDDAAPRVPQPSLADVPRLLADAATAGNPVTLRREGPERPLPALVEQAAYRLVQEALTNLRKHAHGAPGTVLIRHDAGTLTVTVTNAGTSRAPLPAGGGHGLVGLRERVRLLGGTLRAGPGGDGFEVSATLPVGRP